MNEYAHICAYVYVYEIVSVVLCLYAGVLLLKSASKDIALLWAVFSISRHVNFRCFFCGVVIIDVTSSFRPLIFAGSSKSQLGY